MAALKTQRTLLAVLLSSLFLALGEAPAAGNDPTVYQLLEQFDFPKGVLPENVQSYLLRPDGTFEVFFAGDCEFKVQGYVLRYKQRITGTVEKGHLQDLSGVSVKILFVWIGINEVVSSGDQLKFYVGPLSASFARNNFDECPRCRCGFKCSAGALVSDS